MGEGEKRKKKKKNNNGEEKKTKESEEEHIECGGGNDVTMILKINLHCENCARKVERSVKLMEGVESVKADFSSNISTEVEKVDPMKSLEEKTKKKVELVSSSQPSKKYNGGSGGNNKTGKKDHNDKKAKADEDEKNKEVNSTVITMKTIVHCLGCAQKIKKIIRKYKGVEEVNVELEKNQITVKGTMDTKVLLPYLNAKLKRPVEITASFSTNKKDDGSEEKKQQKDGSNKKSQGGDQKEKAATTTISTNVAEKKGGANNKKKEKGTNFSENKQVVLSNEEGENKKNNNNEKKKGGGGGGDINKKKEGEPNAAIDIVDADSSSSSFCFPMNGEKTTLHINKMEFFATYPYGGYAPQPLQFYNNPNQTDGSDYRWQTPDYVHAPQMFSDENPNACSLM